MWSHGSALIRDCHRLSRQEESLYENRYQQFLLHRTKLNARDEQYLPARETHISAETFLYRDLVDFFRHGTCPEVEQSSAE